MKKLFLAFSLLTATFAANAQNQTQTTPANTPILSKKGYSILPEAGDWGLSFSASPIINYFGNAFHGTGVYTAPTTSYTTPYPNIAQPITAITGKYFLDANTAVRALLGVNMTSNTQKALVDQAGSTSTPPAQVTDKFTASTTGFYIGAGLEKRKGIGRVQGFYGAQAILGIASSSNKYTYGNSLTATHQNDAPQFGQANGLLQTKSGSTFTIAVVGFIGVEYFFAPKVSLGAEYQWGPSMSFTGQGSTKVQTWNGATNSVNTTTTKGYTAGSNATSLGLGAGLTSVNLNFYF